MKAEGDKEVQRLREVDEAAERGERNQDIAIELSKKKKKIFAAKRKRSLPEYEGAKRTQNSRDKELEELEQPKAIGDIQALLDSLLEELYNEDGFLIM